MIELYDDCPYARHQLAHPVRRAAAFVVDAMFSGATCGIVSLVLLALFGGSGTYSLSLGGWKLLAVVAAWGSLWEMLWLCSSLRAKPGQALLGFRILRVNGQPVRPMRAVVRAVARTATYPMLPMVPMAMWVFRQVPLRMTPHDFVAGTIAVRVEELQTPAQVPGAGVGVGDEQGARPAEPVGLPPRERPPREEHQGPFV